MMHADTCTACYSCTHGLGGLLYPQMYNEYWSDYKRILSVITAQGSSLIDGAHPGSKTDRDYLGHYCPKTFEMTEGKKEKWCHPESNPGPLA